ncbi:hypothetical protein [Actinoplanes sp. NPDC049802]|uniref:hypothetical protein n=1 Tax=Actinoplanes sp. NPDC049802 TaxID=3154742 RepID=UPI0033D1A57E
MKVVQEMLGHSTLNLTADTYTSVLPEVAREAAEAAARLIPRRTGNRTAGLTSGSQPAGKASTSTHSNPRAIKKPQLNAAC